MVKNDYFSPMNKIILLISLFCSFTAHALTPAELGAQLQASANIQGEFRQERHLNNLPTPLQSRGNFVLVPGKLLLWQMEQPFPLILRVRKDGIAQQDANGKWQASRQSGQDMQVRLFMALLGGDIGVLDGQFTLHPSGSAESWQLQLIPSSPLMQQIFTRITLQGGQVVHTVELVETRGDRTLLVFENVSQDNALPTLAQENLP